MNATLERPIYDRLSFERPTTPQTSSAGNGKKPPYTVKTSIGAYEGGKR